MDVEVGTGAGLGPAMLARLRRQRDRLDIGEDTRAIDAEIDRLERLLEAFDRR